MILQIITLVFCMVVLVVTLLERRAMVRLLRKMEQIEQQREAGAPLGYHTQPVEHRPFAARHERLETHSERAERNLKRGKYA